MVATSPKEVPTIAAPAVLQGSTGTRKELAVYGSFFLGEREFALPAECVKQVVDLPDQWVSLPHSPSFIRGAFDLRGTLITVVDLRLLFEAPESNCPPDTVAVVEYNGQCIAFLFQRTGVVFKGVEDEYSEFDAATRNEFVCGVFRRESGTRPVQLLDLAHLFELANVPRDVTGYSATNSSKQRDRGRRSKFMSFLLGDTHCALPIEEVQEVFSLQTVTKSMLSSRACLGTTEIRGGTIPVIDLAVLLGSSSDSQNSGTGVEGKKVIVMRHGTALFGLVVDSIEDIIAASEDELVSFPTAPLVQTDLFLGCIVTASFPDVLLFNTVSILAHTEISDVARIHGKSSSSLRLASERKEGEGVEEKEQFVTVSAGSKYAIRIREVKEIIDLPDSMLQPPGMSSSFTGVHVLRGKALAPIADLRECPEVNPADGKVLIFDADGGKAGLVVDSVDSIASVAKSDIVLFPSCSNPNSFEVNNMIESIPATDQSGKKTRTSVFKMQALFDTAVASSA